MNLKNHNIIIIYLNDELLCSMLQNITKYSIIKYYILFDKEKVKKLDFWIYRKVIKKLFKRRYVSLIRRDVSKLKLNGDNIFNFL